MEGSRLQPGDEDLDSVPFRRLAGRNLVIEEKVDGANAAISFAEDGSLQLQSRGHYLTGGQRERHFNFFKQWAHIHADRFRGVLSDRYVLYGEWLYAKHTIYYDLLPHYFLEFDVLDTRTGGFLSTPARAELLYGLPLASVRVLHSGPLRSLEQLTALIGRSAFISDSHLRSLRNLVERLRLDADTILRETDPGTTMEGLYIKVEENDAVVERYKYIRASFLTSVLTAQGHWLNRPIVPNQLAPGVGIMTSDTPTS